MLAKYALSSKNCESIEVAQSRPAERERDENGDGVKTWSVKSGGLTRRIALRCFVMCNAASMYGSAREYAEFGCGLVRTLRRSVCAIRFINAGHG